MKLFNTIVFAITTNLYIIGCSNNDNPIVFSKITDDSKIILTLDTNKTFTFTARHVKGAAFDESGTYTINDSTIILQYNNKEYSYNCYTIPLPNDTMLFGHYNNTILLYPLYREIPGIDSVLTHEQVMQRIVNEYNSPKFKTHVGTLIFACTQGNAELLYTKPYKISAYYDSFIK
jgi:hypothetical protein